MVFHKGVLVKDRLEERGKDVARIEKVEVAQGLKVLEKSETSEDHVDQTFVD